MQQYNTFITIGSHLLNAKTQSNSINHCFTNYFKSRDIYVKIQTIIYISARSGNKKDVTLFLPIDMAS